MTNRLVLDLPARTAKPRAAGLSNLVDNGYGLIELQDKLALCADSIDIVKLGWASAYITPILRDKLELFRRYNIRTCFGGMMFELSYWQGKAEDYAGWMQDLGVDLVEVSNGSLAIPEADKCRMVEVFANKGFTVLSEVGSKDVTVEHPPEVWIDAIRADLAAGAWKVITEGRADASAGIYRGDGTLKDDLIGRILDAGIDHDDLIFEAPHKKQMAWFITHVGTNVNIGNVPLAEVLNLETLRLGLRGDTVQHFHGEKGKQ